MDLEEMKQIWKRQRKSEKEMLTTEQLILLLNNKLISMDEKIRKRDWLEISVAAVTALVCGIILFYTDSFWYRMGCLSLIGASILITYKLQKARSQDAAHDIQANQPFRKHLREELCKMRAQEKLLKSVLWWYLLPIFIGLLFFVIGFEEPLWGKTVYLTIVVIVYAYIWWLNQRAVTKSISPLIKELKEAIAFINHKNK